ncbi:hypothetical protein [Salinispira pacifica]
MTGGRYTLSQKIAGRRNFTLYGALNAFSFLLLAGNIITLYILRLGGSPSFIGLVSSFPYISFFFLLVGKQLVPRYGLVRLFAAGWILRYIMVIPLAVTPLIAGRVHPSVNFSIILVSILGFQIFRGVGLVGQSPLVGELSAGRDRGIYLSRFQIVVNAATVLSGVMIALLLNDQVPLARYALLIGTGTLLGLAGSSFLLKLPEPPGIQEGAHASFLRALSDTLRQGNYRRYIAVFAVYCFVTGMMRSFLVVYAKEVYKEPDNIAMLLTVIGNLGAIFMGLVMRQLMDRLGAKPLYVIFSIIFGVSLVPAVISPSGAPMVVLAWLALLFFLTSFGSTGGENASQVYFYGMIRPEEQLNLGILYFVTMGLGGAVGSYSGGLLLEILQGAAGMDPVARFRIFFIVLIAVLAGTIVAMGGLKRLGSIPVTSALGVMFSLRDLRAINLLNRLERTESIGEEQQLIQEIAGSHSGFPAEDLVERLSSPSYVIRSETLRALERLPREGRIRRNSPLERRIGELLVSHLRQHEFTTAYLAARILGKWRITAARDALRTALSSEDYSLVARAMVALARLGDRQSIPRIELVLRGTRNPFILIHGAEALKLFRHLPSVLLLIDIMRREESLPYVRDEIIFAIAGLVGVENWFYPHYRRFLDQMGDAISLLSDGLRTAPPSEAVPLVRSGLLAIPENREAAAETFGAAIALLEDDLISDLPNEVLIRALGDSRLVRFERFLFLIGALLVHRLSGATPSPQQSLAP